MNKDEMIEEMAKVMCALPIKCKECVYNKDPYCIMKKQAIELYEAKCRIIADDEIVESMKTYERARQETAREIFRKLKIELKGIIGLNYLDDLANKYDIKFNDTTYSRG